MMYCFLRWKKLNNLHKIALMKVCTGSAISHLVFPPVEEFLHASEYTERQEGSHSLLAAIMHCHFEGIPTELPTELYTLNISLQNPALQKTSIMCFYPVAKGQKPKPKSASPPSASIRRCVQASGTGTVTAGRIIFATLPDKVQRCHARSRTKVSDLFLCVKYVSL